MLQKPHCDWCAKSLFDNNNNNNNNNNDNNNNNNNHNNNNNNDNENDVGNENENENESENEVENENENDVEKGSGGEVLPSLWCRTGKIPSRTRSDHVFDVTGFTFLYPCCF